MPDRALQLPQDRAGIDWAVMHDHGIDAGAYTPLTAVEREIILIRAICVQLVEPRNCRVNCWRQESHLRTSPGMFDPHFPSFCFITFHTWRWHARCTSRKFWPVSSVTGVGGRGGG